MIKLTTAAKNTIKANSFKSAREIAEIILQKHGIVVSQNYINHLINNQKSESEESTELVLAEIQHNIAEFVDEKTREYLISLDDNIRNIESRLSGPGLSDDQFCKLSKLLADQIKSMLSIKSNESLTSHRTNSNVNVTLSLDSMLESYAKYKSESNNNKVEIESADYKLIE